MLVFFIILSIFLFLLLSASIFLVFWLIRALRELSLETEKYDQSLQHYFEEDEKTIQSMEELLIVFQDFLKTSKIIGKKYDLTQYADYSLFLSNLYQIENIIRRILGTKVDNMEKFQDE